MKKKIFNEVAYLFETALIIYTPYSCSDKHSWLWTICVFVDIMAVHRLLRYYHNHKANEDVKANGDSN